MIRLKDSQLPAIKKKLLAEQNGICPLCKRDMTRGKADNYVVDHDHETGIIRAVLCRNCNGIEGRIKRLAIRCSSKKTYRTWIINLANYLYNHREPQTKFTHPTHLTDIEKRLKKNKVARAAYKKKKLAEIREKSRKEKGDTWQEV